MNINCRNGRFDSHENGLPEKTSRPEVDYALAALSHTYCPTWKGSASVACADNLTQIVGLGSEVYRQLHVLRVRLEMIEQLQAEVLATAALQGVG